MFKPVRILQAGAVFALLSGCASTQTSALSTPSAQSIASQHGTSSSPIRAGISINSTDGFVDASGALEPNVQAYAVAVSQSRNIPLAQVQTILKNAHYNATVARLMAPSKARIRRSWVSYRKRFVEPVRIKAGVAFWTEHRAMLDQTAKNYGVPPSIMVAIIGVETIYGRQTGNFLVLDALATLGFRNPDTARPERSQMFRDQLADLIELDHARKLNALTVKGSFAGAIGLPQFMPGSLMRFAVDGDGDRTIDVRNSPADAAASIANFLRQHGWVPGLPVFAPVVLPANASDLTDGGLRPSYDWAQLKAKGASARPGIANTAWQQYPLGVVDLLDEPRHLAEYRTGTPNFFAITHYNRSYFYATSVADLAQALAERMGYGEP